MSRVESRGGSMGAVFRGIEGGIVIAVGVVAPITEELPTGTVKNVDRAPSGYHQIFDEAFSSDTRAKEIGEMFGVDTTLQFSSSRRNPLQAANVCPDGDQDVFDLSGNIVKCLNPGTGALEDVPQGTPVTPEKKPALKPTEAKHPAPKPTEVSPVPVQSSISGFSRGQVFECFAGFGVLVLGFIGYLRVASSKANKRP